MHLLEGKKSTLKEIGIKAAAKHGGGSRMMWEFPSASGPGQLARIDIIKLK